MAKSKGGLGKGLGALISESTSSVAQDSPKDAPAAAKGSSLPDSVEVDENGGLWIRTELIVPYKDQPRRDFDEKRLKELADNIKQHGILEPVIVQQNGERFDLVAGERRYRAAKLAGLERLPVQIRNFDEQHRLEMALIENIQRVDLNPIEEASAYYNLIQMGDLSQEEVAKRVGKNRATVANSIRLLKLPEDVQKSLASGQITSGHARALLMVKNDSDMRVLFGKIVGSGLSVREAEALAESYNNGGRAAAAKKTKKTVKKDPDVAVFEQELRNIFGVKGVSLKGSSEKGAIQIEYTTQKDFDRICELLKSLGE